jgi:hypothetical protein
VLLVASTGPALATDCTIGPDWKVESVRLLNAGGRLVTNYVELGDVIALKVAGLAELRKCATSGKSIALYMNGMPLKDLAEFPPSDPTKDEAWFTLKINPHDLETWTTLLGRPMPGTTYPVGVSIGLADGYPLPSAATISLRPVPQSWFWVWAVVFAIVLFIFLCFAKISNILRGGTPSGGRIFSLSRSQAAWWFFIVLGSYLLIGLTTGDYANSLNSTAMTLLGIAAATYLGSAAVDASKQNAQTAASQQAASITLAGTLASLHSLIPQAEAAAQAAAAGATADEKQAQSAKEEDRKEAADKAAKSRQDAVAKAAVAAKYKEQQANTEAVQPKLKGESQGWLIDILSDADGIDFHRFQVVGWTLVLGIVFIYDVWQRLAMPEFSGALLGLQGLSAATYVGLKIPEATTPTVQKV